MKFIYADSLDVVDPGYDFIADRNAPGRTPYWDDLYPHELLGVAPYHGMLVSRGIVGGRGTSGKYTEAQAKRLRRAGVRAFLRLDAPGLDRLPVFGDCGAFTYHREEVPPYTPEDTASFYDGAGFTHGCSVDHIIFEYMEGAVGMAGGSAEAKRRFDLTLANAESFLAAAKTSGRFTPLGVIQGWSAASMAEAARRLVKMGYDYLALGGTVPLKTAQVRACLTAIREVIPRSVRIHVLGFARADEITTFAGLGITTFDTSSPMIRSFKDAVKNYYLPAEHGRLAYYTAIRVPQALENAKLMGLARQGALRQEDLTRLEADALAALRAYDKGAAELGETLEAVLAYSAPATLGAPLDRLPGAKSLKSLRERYTRTLADRPWTRCSCAVCDTLSIEAVIFRASNRNKRRGIHNMGVFKALVDNLPQKASDNDQPYLFGDPCQAKPDTPSAVVRRACG